MRAITLLYHDVVERSRADSSGFAGGAAASYKMEPELFEAHLEAIAQIVKPGPVTITELLESPATESPVLLTFDDGGVSCYARVARSLENRGWRGHFLVTANCIGKPGFLNAGQIAELAKRGHVIGTHSYSHPSRMSSLRWEDLCQEWNKSIEVLRETLGRNPTVGSVPGGHYSAAVGRAAASAGLRVLFNSEPVTTCRREHSCLVVGRFTMRPKTGPRMAASICAGHISPRLSQWAGWQIKKGAKLAGGEAYLRLRRLLLERSPTQS